MFRIKNVHIEVGGGQKMAKLCPRSCWMPPKMNNLVGNPITQFVEAIQRFCLAEKSKESKSSISNLQRRHVSKICMREVQGYL